MHLETWHTGQRTLRGTYIRRVIGAKSLDSYFGNTSDEHITDDISQEGYVTSTGEDYPILKVNDLSDDNAMLEFAVIGLECDILKLSFLGRIKG